MDGANAYQSPNNPGWGQKFGSIIPQQARLTAMAQRNQSVQAALQQRQQAARQKANQQAYEKDRIDDFAVKNIDLNNALQQETQQYQQAYANVLQQAESQNRSISPQERASLQAWRSNILKNKGNSETYIEALKEVDSQLKDDKHGIYDKGAIQSQLYGLPQNDDGSYDFSKLSTDKMQEIINNPEYQNKDGLMKRYYAGLEENVANEVALESEKGMLFNTDKKFTFRGQVVTDNNGKPIPDAKGRLQPLVNNESMAILRQSEPNLYKKLEAESEATGIPMQEIYKRDMQNMMGVKEEVSRSRVDRYSDGAEARSKKKAAAKKKEKEETRSRRDQTIRSVQQAFFDEEGKIGDTPNEKGVIAAGLLKSGKYQGQAITDVNFQKGDAGDPNDRLIIDLKDGTIAELDLTSPDSYTQIQGILNTSSAENLKVKQEELTQGNEERLQKALPTTMAEFDIGVGEVQQMQRLDDTALMDQISIEIDDPQLALQIFKEIRNYN